MGTSWIWCDCLCVGCWNAVYLGTRVCETAGIGSFAIANGVAVRPGRGSIATEHFSWIKVLWRTGCGKRFNCYSPGERSFGLCSDFVRAPAVCTKHSAHLGRPSSELVVWQM